MFKRTKRRVPQLNTTSTADISFMLLILFLVTSSMDVDKGLSRQLPPISPKEEQQQPTDASERNVMKIRITPSDSILVNGKPMRIGDLRRRVVDFVSNPSNRADLPQKTLKTVPLVGKFAVSDQHIISMESDRESDYNTYFQVQNEVMSAYALLRNRLALRSFHHSYAQCSEEEKKALQECYPQRISEVYNTQEKGVQP